MKVETKQLLAEVLLSPPAAEKDYEYYYSENWPNYILDNVDDIGLKHEVEMQWDNLLVHLETLHRSVAVREILLFDIDEKVDEILAKYHQKPLNRDMLKQEISFVLNWLKKNAEEIEEMRKVLKGLDLIDKPSKKT